MRRAIPLVVSFAGAAGAVAAQASWTQAAQGPSRRDGAYLVYEPVSQRLFLMEGRTTGTGGATPDPFWSWDGAVWTQATATVTGFLFQLGLGGMCAEGGGSMVLFGGYRPGIGIGGGQPSVLDQTWRVQATSATTLQFTLLAPATSPSPRQGCGLVATPLGAVLFGGCNVNGGFPSAETWLWNGTTWTLLATPASPPGRGFHAMAFDAARNVVVMFGGAIAPSLLDDTWEFDGVTWQQRFPAHQPSARCAAACVWSPVLGKTIISGGGNWGATSTLDDAWAWDGTDWHALAPTGAAPSQRAGASIAWDPGQQKALLFGGRGGVGPQHLQDAFELDVQPWPAPSYTPFGVGCPAPGGPVPVLDVVGDEPPRLGSTTQLRVTSLPVGLSLPVFVLGFSNTWEPSSSHPLPIDLGFLGWPGCQQLVSNEFLDAVPALGGQATHSLAVPFAAQLLGFTFHAQALVLCVPSGAAVSNALTGVVGA